MVFPVFHQSHSDNTKITKIVNSRSSVARIIRDHLLCYQMVLGLNTWFRYANLMFFIYMYGCKYQYMWAHIRCTCMPSNCRNGNHHTAISKHEFLSEFWNCPLVFCSHLLYYAIQALCDIFHAVYAYEECR